MYDYYYVTFFIVKVKQGIMQAEEDEGRIQENNGRALSAKKQATPKTKQNTSPQTTPAMCTLRTPDGKKSAKKTSKKVQNSLFLLKFV